MEQPDALILTGIGIGTSFSVLVLLLVSVLLIRLATRTLGYDEDEDDAVREESPIEDPEMRNRAAAAVVAVTALLESRPYLRDQSTREKS